MNKRIQRILALNVGSSSIKFSLFDQDFELLSSGKITNIQENPIFSCMGESIKLTQTTPKDAITFIINWVVKHFDHITVISHRVIHGGEFYKKPVYICDSVLENLRSLIPLAPLHQPHNIEGIEITQHMFPDILQIACFDTAFHNNREDLFTTYALPFVFQKNVRKYGFHGLSYEWIASVLKKDHPLIYSGNVVVAHLGSGSSLCGMRNGKSIDTTMGLTALSGLPMGTRIGNIDPGAIFYILREYNISADELEHIFYEQSGLKGLSGITNDVKTLLESPHPKAKFAIRYFCISVAKYTASLAVSLNGIDALVFTGGIGENSKPIRELIIKYLDFLKIPNILVIPTNEEKQMAIHAIECLDEKNQIDRDFSLSPLQEQSLGN